MTNKATKRALLTSIISLVICVVMLAGTTFAWFTDSVVSGKNQIIAGNLDVELYHTNENVKDDDVKGDTNLFVDKNGEAILWEPGVVVYENFTVKNVGTLALKYQFDLTIYDEQKTPDGKSLSDVIKVAYVEGGVADDATRDDLIALTEWSDIADIADADKLVAGASKTTGIVLYWAPSANDNDYNMNNENQGKTLSITFGLNLIATQDTVEEDSFDELYDEDAIYYETMVANASELEAAIVAGKKVIAIDGTVTLTKSLGANGVTFIGFDGDDAIDFVTYGISGNGNTFKKLSLDNDRDGWYKGMQYSDGENTTYENCVIVNGVTTYGSSAFKGCTFNELPAGKYPLFVYDGALVTVDDCVFNYGDRAIKIYSEDNNREFNVVVSDTEFRASATTVANKAMIEIDDTLSKSVDATVNNIVIDSYIAAQGVYRVDDGALNTSTAKSKVTVDGVLTTVEAATQAEFDSAISGADNVVVELAAGTYKMPGTGVTKNISIVGTKDTVIDNTLGSYLENATVSFEGVTIKGSTGKANGNGSDYAALYSPNVTYTNCAFEGPFRVGRDGAKFIDCTFTNLGNDYVWAYGNDVTFTGCTFNSEGKALLLYSDGGNEVSKVVVEDCIFNATKSAKAGAIANQSCAAIEIDNYGNGVNLTVSGNTIDDDFSGEWRIKSYNASKPDVIVNGTEYTTIAIDGKTMTIDSDKNVTVNG